MTSTEQWALVSVAGIKISGFQIVLPATSLDTRRWGIHLEVKECVRADWNSQLWHSKEPHFKCWIRRRTTVRRTTPWTETWNISLVETLLLLSEVTAAAVAEVSIFGSHGKYEWKSSNRGAHPPTCIFLGQFGCEPFLSCHRLNLE